MCPTGTSSLRLASSGNSDLRSAFQVLDADHDGRISKEDLRKFYAGFSGAAEEDVIGAMMQMADANRDGYVEYDEFERVLEERETRRERKHSGVMEEVFRTMDRDGDGKVGHEDLRAYLKWAGFEAHDEDINAMIRLGGGDESQGVTFDGLLKILAV